MLGDRLNTEMGNITFGCPEGYNWQLLDDLEEASIILFKTLDKLSFDDDKARFALRKLKTRMNAAIPAVKTAVTSTKQPAASKLASNVGDLSQQLSNLQQEMAEKDQTLLEQEQ